MTTGATRDFSRTGPEFSAPREFVPIGKEIKKPGQSFTAQSSGSGASKTNKTLKQLLALSAAITIGFTAAVPSGSGEAASEPAAELTTAYYDKSAPAAQERLESENDFIPVADYPGTVTILSPG